MGSHSVICHPTQVNTPRLNPSRLRLDLPTTEGWKAELTEVAAYIPRWFTLTAIPTGIAAEVFKCHTVFLCAVVLVALHNNREGTNERMN